MSRIVLFEFAGREENLSVQLPYLRRLIDAYDNLEVHLWDLTRRPSDADYIRRVAAERPSQIKVLDTLHPGHPIQCAYPNHARRPRGWRRCECMVHKPPYERPYRYYAMAGEADDRYIKIDDDVLFLETSRLDDLLAPLDEHPERIISAAVINNAVCSKYLPNAGEVANRFAVGDPTNFRNDKRWWALHTMPEFADYMHNWFLDRMTSGANPDHWEPAYVRSRPGEAVSINCIAFTQATMRRLAPMMGDRLGDEGAVDRLLPWICTSFYAAHLTFGPQDAVIDPWALDKWREWYTDLGKRYLA